MNKDTNINLYKEYTMITPMKPMIPCLLIVTKLLFLVTILGLGGVFLAIYGTIYANHYDPSLCYQKWISALGTCTYPYYWNGYDDDVSYNEYCELFAAGFTITGICITIGFTMKMYILRLLIASNNSNISCCGYAILVSIAILSIIGSIGLIMVGVTPWDKDDGYGLNLRMNIYHFIGAAFGIGFIAVTQLLDAIHWIKYMHMGSNSDVVEVKWNIYSLSILFMHLYALICPLLSMIFGSIYAILYYDHDREKAINAEWKCLLFLCLGNLVQLAHFIFIHSHLKKVSQVTDDNQQKLSRSVQQTGNTELNRIRDGTEIREDGNVNQITKELL